MIENNLTHNSKNQKRIILTGGGSAGHVTPNLALIEKLRSQNCRKAIFNGAASPQGDGHEPVMKNWQIYYIGSKNGQEKQLIKSTNIPYFSIATGKLRRYFSWQNFLDPLKILFGIIQAFILCLKIKPRVVFSKGGFVAFPVVFAAWLLRIPVIIHESDFSPGLANRLSFPFATKICYTFKATKDHINPKYKDKLIWSGTPIRSELFQGNADLGRKICNFIENKKIILVQGGGLGSDDINQLIRQLLPTLLTDFQIIHSCGKGKIDPAFSEVMGYYQSEYFHEDLPHIIACADFVISRAGANSLHELLALKKPHLLLPLSKKSSRGDQLLNAKYYNELGLSAVVYPEEHNTETLLDKIHELNANLKTYQNNLNRYQCANGVETIYFQIVET